MRCRGLVFVWVAACASGQAEPVEPPPGPSSPGPPPVAAGPEAQPVCRVLPEPASPEPAAKGRCGAVAKKVQSELRPRLERGFRPTAPGATLELRYACDPIAAPWELVFETGSGHGQGLALVRLRWQGAQLAGLRISRRGGLVQGDEATVVERVVIEGTQVDRALPGLRGLLAVQLTERVPVEPQGGSGYGASGSWHARVSLRDTAGHVRERGFTGSDGGSEQVHSIPVAEITATLRPLIDAFPWQTAAVDDDARAFFVSRFIAAGPDQAAWWIKERLVVLAADVGTPALIPRLVRLAQDIRVDASVQRTRDHALAAVARLAQFDARIDERGAPVPTEQAVTIYAHACLP